VEAAAAVLAARVRPLVFVAHTALGPELPTYLPARARSLAARAGVALDVSLARRADATLAVSPRLAEHLSSASGRDVRHLPVPWTIPPPIEPAERRKARARFGFGPLDPVVLYAGNLDAYQGLELLARAFAVLSRHRADARLLVATASAPEPLEKALWSLGCMERTTFAPLADEPDRRIAHAAADVACINRAVEGGLPIKLLDALARGVPSLVSRRATAGLALGDAAIVVPDDDHEAFAAAALIAIEARESAPERGRRGVEYVRRAHAPAEYLRVLDQALKR
jgi:glycosyltransferase involved in cell wall biosynthesis